MSVLDELEVDEQTVQPNPEEEALDELLLSGGAEPDGEDPKLEPEPEEKPDLKPEAEETPKVDEEVEEEPSAEDEKPKGDTVPLAVALGWKADAKEAKQQLQVIQNQKVQEATANISDGSEQSPMEAYITEHGEDLRFEEIPAKVHIEQKKWDQAQSTKHTEAVTQAESTAKVQATLEHLKGIKGPHRALVNIGSELLDDNDMRMVITAENPRQEFIERSWNAIQAKGSDSEKAAAQALFPNVGKPKPKPSKTGTKDAETSTDKNLNLEPDEEPAVDVPDHVNEIVDFLDL